jgi:DNA-binding NtrC family response regulator
MAGDLAPQQSRSEFAGPGKRIAHWPRAPVALATAVTFVTGDNLGSVCIQRPGCGQRAGGQSCAHAGSAKSTLKITQATARSPLLTGSRLHIPGTSEIIARGGAGASFSMADGRVVLSFAHPMLGFMAVTASLAQLAQGWEAVRQELAAPAKVLLVEDETVVCELFRIVLSKANFVCTACHTAEDALKHLEETRFNVVVTDKNLPGLSGLDLVARARSRDADCAAVVITGYPNLDSVVRAIELQNVEFLTKPLDSNEALVASVSRANLRRGRRVLVRRMLADLRGALSEQADGTALSELVRVHRQIDDYRTMSDRKRCVLCWQGEDSAVLNGLATMAQTGFEIVSVRSGTEALKYCERHPVSVLVVSDHFGDMSGDHLVKRLIEFEGHPELVYVTAQTNFQHAVAAIQRGATGFLVKPIKDLRELVHAVHRACGLQHERMVNFKMIAELSRILMEIEQRREVSEARVALQTTLAELDVRSAEHAIRSVDEASSELGQGSAKGRS